jgi:hypothetical protein
MGNTLMVLSAQYDAVEVRVAAEWPLESGKVSNSGGAD